MQSAEGEWADGNEPVEPNAANLKSVLSKELPLEQGAQFVKARLLLRQQ
ncbi:MAG: hypothetical protein N2116_04550 [Armatimonadetes bacterium]|nr:hypothetical protein [Armatimonadota bacterium]